MSDPVRRSRVEVDLDAVRHNVTVLRGRLPDASFCAVVKADGYGHGAVAVAHAALEAGADWLAVALVEEGERLREAGITAPVLLLYEPPVAAADRVLAASLTPTVTTVAFGAALDRLCRPLSSPTVDDLTVRVRQRSGIRGERTAIHLGFDTGMGRSGAPPPAWDDLIAAARGWQGLVVDGVWSHLARADEMDATTNAEQVTAFGDVLERITSAGLTPRLVHLANSAGGLLHPGTAFDLVRFGIALYGLSPSRDVLAVDHGLRQAVRLVTEVGMAKRLTAGTPVSYGHSWSAPSDGWLVTLPIGYADGVLRGLTNRGQVLIDGRRFPMVGNVTMDLIMAWCGDHEPAVGDEVVLLGSQGDEQILVDEWADILGTISYEITCTLGARLPRTTSDSADA